MPKEKKLTYQLDVIDLIEKPLKKQLKELMQIVKEQAETITNLADSLRKFRGFIRQKGLQEEWTSENPENPIC